MKVNEKEAGVGSYFIKKLVFIKNPTLMTFTWITSKLILGRYSSWSLTSASRMQVSNRQWSSCSVVDFQMALYLSTKYT